MIGLAAALLAAPAHGTSFRELRCTGVPHYPRSKRVLLQRGQINESVMTGGMFSIVEFEGMVGLIHYDVLRKGPRTLEGTATHINTLNWQRRSSPVECRILR